MILYYVFPTYQESEILSLCKSYCSDLVKNTIIVLNEIVRKDVNLISMYINFTMTTCCFYYILTRQYLNSFQSKLIFSNITIKDYIQISVIDARPKNGHSLYIGSFKSVLHIYIQGCFNLPSIAMQHVKCTFLYACDVLCILFFLIFFL